MYNNQSLSLNKRKKLVKVNFLMEQMSNTRDLALLDLSPESENRKTDALEKNTAAYDPRKSVTLPTFFLRCVDVCGVV